MKSIDVNHAKSADVLWADYEEWGRKRQLYTVYLGRNNRVYLVFDKAKNGSYEEMQRKRILRNQEMAMYDIDCEGFYMLAVYDFDVFFCW